MVQTACYNQAFVVTELFVSGTQCSVIAVDLRWSIWRPVPEESRTTPTCDGVYDALRHLTHPMGVPGENHLRHVWREAPGLRALIHAEASHLHPRDVPEEQQRTRVHVVLVQLLRGTDALVCAYDDIKKPFTLSLYNCDLNIANRWLQCN